MDDYIRLRGVNVNNLKDIDIDIKKGEITVFTGLSGSGKSSLVFDTIAAEAKRQVNRNQPMYLRRRMELIERPDARLIDHLTPSIVVSQKSLGGGSRSTVGTVIDASPLLRLLFSRIGKPSLGTASAYRLSDPKATCPVCKGEGVIKKLDEKSLFNLDSTVAEKGIDFPPIGGSWQKTIYVNSGLFDINKPLRDFTDEEWKNLAYGPDQVHKVKFLSNKTGQSFEETYEGVIPRFKRLYLDRDISRLSNKVQDQTEEKLDKEPCKECQGTGFSQAVLDSRINGLNIVDFYQMEMGPLLEELNKISDPLGKSLADQLINTIERMLGAGIGYLNLARRVDSLSGGERQRLKLVANLGSSLNNITYILDEPSSGLHPHDIGKVKNLILDLKEDKNTVLVVEHNREIMAMADRIVDMGPRAGAGGGRIVFEGSFASLLDSDTLTGKYLNKTYKFSKKKKSFDDFYHIEKARTNNLKNISVKCPKNALTVIAGVAGSGKSSLVHGEFMKKYPDAIYIYQKGIGLSSRSTPATYVNIMDDIRKIFARENKNKPSMFSFNSKGACPVCRGKGVLKPDVAFADPVSVTCEACGGTRYSDEARSFSYQGLNIVEVLDLTVSEALDFFKDEEKIIKRLSLLDEVGLSYLSLGQPTSTLSGGELQRLKLALKLQVRGFTYILDEPSTGLHMANIEKLIELFRKIINKGNSLIIIEHNPIFWMEADWLIDLGPGAGSKGGELLFEGYPEDIIHSPNSLTGAYLKKLIS